MQGSSSLLLLCLLPLAAVADPVLGGDDGGYIDEETEAYVIEGTASGRVRSEKKILYVAFFCDLTVPVI